MEVRDGLSASAIPAFETAMGEVPLLLDGLDGQISNTLLADIRSVEALSLTLLVYGSPAKARHFLHKSNSRLAGRTPLECVRSGGIPRDQVITGLFKLIEGYVF